MQSIDPNNRRRRVQLFPIYTPETMARTSTGTELFSDDSKDSPAPQRRARGAVVLGGRTSTGTEILSDDSPPAQRRRLDSGRHPPAPPATPPDATQVVPDAPQPLPVDAAKTPGGPSSQQLAADPPQQQAGPSSSGQNPPTLPEKTEKTTKTIPDIMQERMAQAAGAKDYQGAAKWQKKLGEWAEHLRGGNR
jgi:hypothetical protein